MSTNKLKIRELADYDKIPEDERDNNSWWYLHGELEEIIGYDKGVVCNCKSGGFGVETLNTKQIDGELITEIDENKPIITKMCFEGIVNVKVESVNQPCIGYFWTDNYRDAYWKGKLYKQWRQRGLVCLKSDVEGIKLARKMYMNRD